MAPETNSPARHGTGIVQTLLFLAGVSCYLYICLFSLSGIPFFRTGDESFFWVYAYRMLSGQVFLRDFHQFTPPGADLFYLGVFRLWGVSVASISWAKFTLGLALAVACFVVSKHLMRLHSAMLAALACVVLLYGDRLDATHHWLSSLAGLLAIWILFPSRSMARIAAASVLIALAAFCTQTAGAMALLACCASFLWERRIAQVAWRQILCRIAVLTGGACFVWALLSWRFIAPVGWSSYWYAQVLYPQKYVHFDHQFLIPQFARPAHLHAWITLLVHGFVYVAFVCVCPCVIWICARRRSWLPTPAIPLILVAFLGTFQMLEVITRLNWNRMDGVAMPALILCAWLIEMLMERMLLVRTLPERISIGRQHTMARLLLPACGSLLGCLMLVGSLTAQFHPYRKLAFPSGSALFQMEDAEEAEWLLAHTHPGDSFLEVANLRFYVPFRLENPGPVDALSPNEVTRPAWVVETIIGLERSQTEYLLWSPRMMANARVQDLTNSPSDHLDPLRIYVQTHFTRCKVFADGDEVWQRIANSALTGWKSME